MGRQGIQYFRYMDDIIVLAETKRQYRKARKILYRILDELKLKLSPHKTKMGALSIFHFLEVNFELPRSVQNETQVKVTIHPRSCIRAHNLS